MTDRTYATMKDVDEARGVIRSAESDLGKLSRGQRRDLLKDNFPWHVLEGSTPAEAMRQACELVASREA